MSDSNTVVTGNPVIDVEKIRKDFPVLSQTVRGKPLIYLDSSNSSQKPLSVINTLDSFYKNEKRFSNPKL